MRFTHFNGVKHTLHEHSAGAGNPHRDVAICGSASRHVSAVPPGVFWPGRHVGTLSALLGLAMLAGCPGPAFQETGPQSRPAVGRARVADAFDLETVAFPRPELTAVPPDVLAGRPEPFVVKQHDALRGAWRLVLEPEAGRPVRLDYRIADGVRLPVEVDERLLWSLPLDDAGQPEGLVIREADQTLRAMVSIDGGLTEPVGLDVTADFATGSLIYTEVLATAGCLVSVDHHPLVLRSDVNQVQILPGTSRLVDLLDADDRPRFALTDEAGQGIPYEMFVLDVSRPTPRKLVGDDGRCPRPAHVSWVLMLLRGLEPEASPQ